VGVGVIGMETIALAAGVTSRVEPQLDTEARESARSRWRRFVQVAAAIDEPSNGSPRAVS
jgi:hypothetical protein